MNFLTCPECKNECHRREYRKHEGGIHHLCKACRKKVHDNKMYHRKKLTEIRKLNEEDLQSNYKTKTAKALISEYKKATRLNRNRIKVLEGNKNPTRATIVWLNKRRMVQQQWIDGLNDLMTQLHQNKKVPTLCEYMSGNGQLD